MKRYHYRNYKFRILSQNVILYMGLVTWLLGNDHCFENIIDVKFVGLDTEYFFSYQICMYL